MENAIRIPVSIPEIINHLPLKTVWQPSVWLLPVLSLSLPNWQKVLQAGISCGDPDRSYSEAWHLPGPLCISLFQRRILPQIVKNITTFLQDFLDIPSPEPITWSFGCISETWKDLQLKRSEVSSEYWGLTVPTWVPPSEPSTLPTPPHLSQSCWELTSVKTPYFYLEGRPIYCD